MSTSLRLLRESERLPLERLRRLLWTSTKRDGPASFDACFATAKQASARDRSALSEVVRGRRLDVILETAPFRAKRKPWLPRCSVTAAARQHACWAAGGLRLATAASRAGPPASPRSAPKAIRGLSLRRELLGPESPLEPTAATSSAGDEPDLAHRCEPLWARPCGARPSSEHASGALRPEAREPIDRATPTHIKEERLLTRMRIMIPSLVATAAIAIPAVAAADDSVSVCNEAENAPRGGYVVADGPVEPGSARLPARLADASRQRQRGGPGERCRALAGAARMRPRGRRRRRESRRRLIRHASTRPLATARGARRAPPAAA